MDAADPGAGEVGLRAPDQRRGDPTPAPHGCDRHVIQPATPAVVAAEHGAHQLAVLFRCPAQTRIAGPQAFQRRHIFPGAQGRAIASGLQPHARDVIRGYERSQADRRAGCFELHGRPGLVNV